MNACKDVNFIMFYRTGDVNGKAPSTSTKICADSVRKMKEFISGKPLYVN